MSAPSSLESRFDQHPGTPCLGQPPAGLSTRLVHWRNTQQVRKALQCADDPGLVLDLPCDSGRFWPVLAEKDSRIIVAADQSADAIHAACASHEPELARRIMPLQTTLLDIDLPDNCVDCIFCVGLYTQVRDSMLRMELLQEFHRVTRETVILCVNTDGNLAAWQQRYLPDHQAEDVLILPRARLEKEFSAAGFQVLQRLDFAPWLSMRRLYVLQKERTGTA